jgi:hypothetical protein
MKASDFINEGLPYKGEDFEPGEDVVIVSGPHGGKHGEFVKYDTNGGLIVKLPDSTLQRFNIMNVEAPEDYYGDEEDVDLDEASLGLGAMMGQAARKLGAGVSNLAKVSEPKSTSTVTPKAPSAMAKVLSPASKLTPPNQAQQQNQQQDQQEKVKQGDSVDVPGLGTSKVVRSDIDTVTLQPDKNDPRTTMTILKKKLGFK